MKRRFEVFVSSTFEDLQEERGILHDEIIHTGHIPVGMELFRPSHRPPWDKIREHITTCDYYVLISAGRYGTLYEGEEVSYTEKEFDLAVSLGKPIMVLMLSDDALEELPGDSKEATSQGGECLLRFRGKLREKYVLFYEPGSFESTVNRELHRWIDEHVDEANGWVPARALRIEQTRKEVYAYLFDRLNPYQDLRLASEFIKDLRRELNSIADTLFSLEILINRFVRSLVEPDVRVYFAYPLSTPVEVAADQLGLPKSGKPCLAYYRFGISTSREGAWLEGQYVGRPSNIDRAFQQRSVAMVRFAMKSIETPDAANQVVPDEGSVIATPVLYGGSPGGTECIGVVGLSSPREEEATEGVYPQLADEISTLFSGLFFGYARRRSEREGEQISADSLREEIAAYYL